MGAGPIAGGRALNGYLGAALGGSLGALLRLGVQTALPHRGGGWPWATLLVNLTGCALIGVLLAVLLARAPAQQWLRIFLGVGVLGGYTTYSTFALDVVALVEAPAWGAAAGYLFASVGGGLLAVLAGLLAGRGLVGAGRSPAAERRADEGRM